MTKPKASDFKEVNKSMARGKKERGVFIRVLHINGPCGTIYTDQMDKFPITFRRGHAHIVVTVKMNSGNILIEPMKSKMDVEMQCSCLKLVNYTEQDGVYSEKYMLDTECSSDPMCSIKETCKFKLMPLDSHEQNIAKVAIKTFKNHFTSTLMVIHLTFPVKL